MLPKHWRNAPFSPTPLSKLTLRWREPIDANSFQVSVVTTRLADVSARPANQIWL